jgi:hypothetical protein
VRTRGKIKSLRNKKQTKNVHIGNKKMENKKYLHSMNPYGPKKQKHKKNIYESACVEDRKKKTFFYLDLDLD